MLRQSLRRRMPLGVAQRADIEWNHLRIGYRFLQQRKLNLNRVIAHDVFGGYRELPFGRQFPRRRLIDCDLAQRSAKRSDVWNRDSRPAAAMSESEDEDSFRFRRLQVPVSRGCHRARVNQAGMRHHKRERSRQKGGTGPLQG